MKRDIEIELNPNPKEVAEMLFNLDNKEVAEVFAHWKKLFDIEYDRRSKAKESIHIFDLNHFFLYVADELDNDGIDFFRSAYASIIYKYIDDIHKKHLLEINF